MYMGLGIPLTLILDVEAHLLMKRSPSSPSSLTCHIIDGSSSWQSCISSSIVGKPRACARNFCRPSVPRGQNMDSDKMLLDLLHHWWSPSSCNCIAAFPDDPLQVPHARTCNLEEANQTRLPVFKCDCGVSRRAYPGAAPAASRRQYVICASIDRLQFFF